VFNTQTAGEKNFTARMQQRWRQAGLADGRRDLGGLFTYYDYVNRTQSN